MSELKVHNVFRVMASAMALPLVAGLFIACSQDLYQQRTARMNGTLRAFYDHLKADRTSAALVENEKLEALAASLRAEIQQRGPLSANQVDRDWMLLKTAQEAAAENWLTLARYFVLKGRYEEAGGAYRRILNAYSDALYQPYLDQARTGFHNLEILTSGRKPLR
ncbi:MAG: hypothetical protein C4293_09160 [Nitrospiraceae bacterium]